jgi:hypothetical protein
MARDYTKYTVKGLGENLNKRQLVFEILKDYTEKKKPSFDELTAVFKDDIQGSKGFIRKAAKVEDPKRFNTKMPLKIKFRVEVVVSNQWGTKNIAAFLELADKLGYKVTATSSESKSKSKEISSDIASPLSAEQIAEFKERETEEIKGDYTENSWEASSLYDDLIEAGDNAWADQILQKIEDVAEDFSDLETVGEKLKEREETERLLAIAKKAEAKIEDSADHVSLANLISKADEDWAMKLYHKAEEIAEDFRDFNNLGDALADEDYLDDKETALRLQRKAFPLVDGKWEKQSFIRSLQDLGPIGAELLGDFMDIEDKAVPKMKMPENLFASYYLPWGRFVSLRLDNAPDCDTMSFCILLDMKEQKIVGKPNEDDKLRRWFDEREVRLYDDFENLKRYDGVLTISGGYSKHTEDWQISCHTGYEELLDGELPKDASGDELYRAVGHEGEVYQLYRYLLDNADETGIKVGLSEEDITALTEADSGYDFSEILTQALDKDQLDALDYEPLLIEMAKENTLKGKAFNLDLMTVASWVNQHFGNLCYRAYYKEDGISKTTMEYKTIWGELVTAIAERAESANDYINLASCVQMQFTAFEDEAECKQFAHENYYLAIEALDSVDQLVDLVGGHLNEEYYENEELTAKAGEKALASASTFQDYAYICFDDDERCSFSDTEIYKTAIAKAVELKDQADEDQMDRFKMMLDEWEDEETLGLL